MDPKYAEWASAAALSGALGKRRRVHRRGSRRRLSGAPGRAQGPPRTPRRPQSPGRIPRGVGWNRMATVGARTRSQRASERARGATQIGEVSLESLISIRSGSVSGSSGEWGRCGGSPRPLSTAWGPYLLGGEVRGGERAGACLRALIGRPLMLTVRTSGRRPGPSGRLEEPFAGARRGPRRRASRVRPRAPGPRRTPTPAPPSRTTTAAPPLRAPTSEVQR